MTETHNFSVGVPFNLVFSADAKTIYYLRGQRRDAQANLYAFSLESKKEKLLLSATKLLSGEKETLSPAEKAVRERKRIRTSGFTSFSATEDRQLLLLQLGGRTLLYNLSYERGFPLEIAQGALTPTFSPDGKKIAFASNNNVSIATLPTSWPEDGTPLKLKITQVTTSGTEEAPFGVAEFVAQEEMSRYQGFWWSPDSDILLIQRSELSQLETFFVHDAAEPAAVPGEFRYPRPGHENARVTLHAFSLHETKSVEIKWPQEPFPYLAKVVWQKQAPLSFVVQARDQKKQQFRRADVATGESQLLLEENDNAWLNIHDSTPRWANGGQAFFWATESSGKWSLVKHSSTHPQNTQTVINKEHNFDQLIKVSGQKLFYAARPTPLARTINVVDLKSGDHRVIAEGKGEFSAVVSPDGKTIALRRSTYNGLATWEVRHREKAATLPSKTEKPSFFPKVEFVEPDQAAGFHAAIVRPRNFRRKKKYPVLLYTYGGPGSNVVRNQSGYFFMHQWLADQGFVVVSIDGRGTQFRGRKFERALSRRIGDVPANDQVKGLGALLGRYPEMDRKRVGVYGWSFGGYLSLLLAMKHPDVFSAAVAGAPVTDWAYYDTHYTERYLGLLPENAAAYKKASVLTHAKKLERPLLLVHGIQDDNVYFAHTLKLAERLFHEGKSFELLPLVGLTHQIADTSARSRLFQRVISFLRENL